MRQGTVLQDLTFGSLEYQPQKMDLVRTHWFPLWVDARIPTQHASRSILGMNDGSKHVHFFIGFGHTHPSRLCTVEILQSFRAPLSIRTYVSINLLRYDGMRG
jgi:hypothetical protein